MVTVTAQAQSINPGLDDKWQFSLGLFSQNNDAIIRSTAPNDQPIDIDLEDLGLDESETVPQIGAYWRINDKWRLNFVVSDMGISSFETVDTTFNYDGVTYPVNANLSTNLDIRLYIVSLDYAFSKSETTEWSVGLGLHAIDLGLGIDATLNNAALGSGAEDFLAPAKYKILCTSCMVTHRDR